MSLSADMREAVQTDQSLIWKLDRNELRALSKYGRTQKFRQNAVIVNEGDAANSIFVIRAGRVKVFLRNDAGREMVLNVHGPGEFFGEMGLDKGARSASVATLEASQFLVIPKADFSRFVSDSPDFAMKLIIRLMQRVRALTHNVGDLALLDVYGRVARLLLELAKEYNGELKITQRLTHKDIGERVGASREMISRIFKDLVTGGYISVMNRQITIHHLPKRW
jgi:CRP/FNR family cyclic AMP-dependent transcriptional regulator